jgi:amino acid permease
MEAILYQRNSMTKVLSMVGLAALAAAAAWQFYVFATFKNTAGAVDVQGGSLHLWLAIGLAVLVCLGGFFLFSKLLSYDKQNEMHITSTAQTQGPTGFRKDVL